MTEALTLSKVASASISERSRKKVSSLFYEIKIHSTCALVRTLIKLWGICRDLSGGDFLTSKTTRNIKS